MARLLLVLLLAAGMLASLALSQASAEPVQARVVDRTFACSIGSKAGVRSVEVRARSGTRLFGDSKRWKFRASASVRDRSASAMPYSLAWLVAGWPPDGEPGRTASPVSLGISMRCRGTAAIRLARAGLAGSSASPLADEYHCGVPRTVLVRTRAVYRTPTTLRRDRRSVQLTSSGPLVRGELMLRTPSGRPVLYARVHESGRASVFVGGSCKPDLISRDG